MIILKNKNVPVLGWGKTKMKKLTVALCILLLAIMLSACSWGKVGEKQIKQDLQNKFAEQEFVVNDVEIVLAKHEKTVSLYDVNVRFTASNAIAQRKYRVLYSYYDTGGWIMEDVFETETENWKAVPTEFDVPNEKIAQIIFTKDTHRNGFRISKEIIPNVKFDEWTQDVSGEKSAEEYIDHVFPNNTKDGNTTINVQCSARSSKWRITEEFLLHWKFNIKELKWEFVSGESIDHNIEFFDGIEGLYWRNISYNERESIEIKIIDGSLVLFDNSGWITGENTKRAQIEITGLFNGRIYYNSSEVRSLDFITAGEKMQINVWGEWKAFLFRKE